MKRKKLRNDEKNRRYIFLFFSFISSMCPFVLSFGFGKFQSIFCMYPLYIICDIGNNNNNNNNNGEVEDKNSSISYRFMGD